MSGTIIVSDSINDIIEFSEIPKAVDVVGEYVILTNSVSTCCNTSNFYESTIYKKSNLIDPNNINYPTTLAVSNALLLKSDSSIVITGITNSGSGFGLYNSLSNNVAAFKTILPLNGIYITSSGDTINIGTTNAFNDYLLTTTFNIYTGTTSTIFNTYTGSTSTMFNTYTGDTSNKFNNYLLISAFNTYTGSTNTKFNDYILTTIFNTYTGSTSTIFNTYTGSTESKFNTYTGDTSNKFNNYLLISAFNTYTGSTNTKFNDYILTTIFNTYTGSTSTIFNTYTGSTESKFNTYTGDTSNKFNNYLLISAFNTYTGNTSIIFNTYTGSTSTRLNNIDTILTGSTNWNWTYNRVVTGATNWDTAYSWGNHANAGYSLNSHKHNSLYQPDNTNAFVYTDNNRTLHIDGNIVQSGNTYCTHAEHIYTNDDLITLRNGAISGLPNGEYAGIIAKKYDGVNDGSLVFDNTGTARVGDVGSEQPLTTRIEVPVNGQFAYWESGNTRLNFKALQATDVPTLAYLPLTGGTLTGRLTSPALTVDTNTLFVDGVNHRVGIGTTTPSAGYQLHVNGVAGATVFTVPSYNTTLSANKLGLYGAYGAAIVGSTNTPNGGNLSFGPLINNVHFEKMTLLANGNVGIGTNTPNNLIQVLDLVNFDNTNFNTKLGYEAGKNIVAGSQNNTFIGYQAGLSSLASSTNAADYNTAIGFQSLYSNTAGYSNTALGTYALYYNCTGYFNIAVGGNSLASNSTGFDNLSIGVDSMYYNTIGTHNIAYGAGSLSRNVANSRSIAIGINAMLYADNRTSGRSTYNVALGYEALRGSTTPASNVGQYNTAIGDSSLWVNTSGYNNSAIGTATLATNTTGYNNSALGYNAGRFIANGSSANATSTNSLYLGYDARAQANGDINEIVIGANTIGNGSNTVTLGADTITKTILKGDVGIGVIAPQAKLHVAGTIKSDTSISGATICATTSFSGNASGLTGTANNLSVNDSTCLGGKVASAYLELVTYQECERILLNKIITYQIAMSI